MSLNDTTITYSLTNARVVALLDGGGVVVEKGKDLEYIEGRSMILTAPDYKVPLLEVSCRFNMLDAPIPDMMELSDAWITIEGDCDGQRIELRGEGNFGYTDHGTFEGTFSEPPKMILEQVPKQRPNEDDDVDDGLTPAEWMAHMETVRVKASPQFDRACRARDPKDAMVRTAD
jgi:hypothetical protein